MRKTLFLVAALLYLGLETGIWTVRPGGLFPRTPSGYAVAFWHHTHSLPGGPAFDIVDGQSCGFPRADAERCESAIAKFEDSERRTLYTGCVARITRRSWEHLQLAPGKPVWAQVKAAALIG